MNRTLIKEYSASLITILACLIVGTIAYPIKIHNGAIAFFLVASFVQYRGDKSNVKDYVQNPVFILICVHFGVIVFGLIHTSNLSYGLQELERSFYPIVMLLVVFLMKWRRLSLNEVLLAFTIGCFLVVLLGMLYGVATLKFTEFTEILSHGHNQFTHLVGIGQPLYLVVYFIAITFFLLEMVRVKNSELTLIKKLFYLIGIIGAVLMVFFLRPKTGLLIFPVLMFLYAVLILNRRGWFFAFLIFTVSVVAFLLDKSSVLEVVDQYGSTVSTAFDQRLFIWKGALEGVKNSPLIGAGTGGTQELLNEGYRSIGYEEGVVNEFNAHNQYLQFVARNGLLELTVFLTILGYSFWRSSKQSNYAFLMFNMLVAFVMITESFLSVQKGIVFFYFFLLAFIYLGDTKSEKEAVL